jgi:hypothetical protein
MQCNGLQGECADHLVCLVEHVRSCARSLPYVGAFPMFVDAGRRKRSRSSGGGVGCRGRLHRATMRANVVTMSVL